MPISTSPCSDVATRPDGHRRCVTTIFYMGGVPFKWRKDEVRLEPSPIFGPLPSVDSAQWHLDEQTHTGSKKSTLPAPDML